MHYGKVNKVLGKEGAIKFKYYESSMGGLIDNLHRNAVALTSSSY